MVSARVMRCPKLCLLDPLGIGGGIGLLLEPVFLHFPKIWL